MIKMNERLNTGRVVYIKGNYYITELTRPMDDQKLYRVFIDDDYWRNKKISKYANVDLGACVNWIAERRCFNEYEKV